MLAAVPNADILITPLTTREAILSSRIEGTVATMGDVLGFEAGQAPDSPARRDDFQEVLNYRSALRRAEELLAKLPLSPRVIREAHAMLLRGARGEGKAPGEFRRIPTGSARPAAPSTRLHSCRWERTRCPRPCPRGSGTSTGRRWIGSCSWRFCMQSSRRCTRFSTATVAEENLEKAHGIVRLHDAMVTQVTSLTRSHHAVRAMDWIFAHPIFASTHFVAAAGIPEPTARRFLRVLVQGDILHVLRASRGRRTGILAFRDLLNVVEGRTVL